MTKSSPMLEQYQRIKREHPDRILFFRMGDFYEMFFDDAKVAAQVLDIALTSRDKDKETGVPMCGVPHHAAEQYIARLISAGFSVAVCDQVEDPRLAKGIVKREVTRVITPGTALLHLPLLPEANSYLLCAVQHKDRLGLACCDLSTGEFRVTELKTLQELGEEIKRFKPQEMLLSEEVKENKGWGTICLDLPEAAVRFLPPWLFDYRTLHDSLLAQFKVASLDGFGCQGLMAGIVAAGIVLHYLKETQKRELSHIVRLIPYQRGEYLVVDNTTRTHLEITTSFADGSKRGSLLGLLDRTVTSVGARKLRRWLDFPLLKVEEIDRRLDAVDELKEKMSLRRKVKELLRQVADLERITARISLSSAAPRDLISLKNSLSVVPGLKKVLEEAAGPLLQEIRDNLGEFKNLVNLIEKGIADNPAATLKAGGLIKEGYHPDLDELRTFRTQGKDWIARLERKEKERTGIPNLRVGYNNIFGYYLEVTRSQLAQVPQDYRRKQTLVNAERFVTAELKEYETQVLGAEEKICSLEYTLFTEIRQEAACYSREVSLTADYLAILDVLAAWAEVGQQMNYTRPVVNQGDEIEIKDGRHPVVEHLYVSEKFVPNDTRLDLDSHRLLIITGPNMAGKSTYIRQVALIVFMAQIGSLVPAREAKIGLVDRLFARVGASDNLARGQSTFMVEMSETANILNNATKRSLIILDEIGRGTSTYDGISIAWSVAEHIGDLDRLGAKTLFATHYHELTELALTKAGIKNYNVAVKEWNDEIIFLRRIVEGGSDRSYGIQVGRLAGLPPEVVARAKEILARLERGDYSRGLVPEDSDQLNLFQGSSNPLKEALRHLDLNEVTPIQALMKLKEWKEKFIKEE